MLSIQTEPAAVSPAKKNPVALKLQTDNYITDPGNKCYIGLVFSGDPVVGDTLRFVWSTYDITFTFIDYADTPDYSGLQIFTHSLIISFAQYAEQVAANLRSNYLLNRDFKINVAASGVSSATIAIEARETGEVYALTVDDSVSNMALAYGPSGGNTIVRDNFKANVFLHIEDDFNSGVFIKVIEKESPVDTNNQATFLLEEELESYLAPDVPAFNQAVISRASNVFKRYYFSYAESYGIPAEVQYVAESSIKKAVLAGYAFNKFPENTFLEDYITN
ncbi:MAG: hypothetical protein EOP53_02345, partial [Sphingobacteriales bacterium]